ncbi:hypothetical protein [Longimicrobium sp.]|uniref:hypothetical protein n=1 Tax=Longimicrobium sp. TaxID=2029185 RepID=UPI002C0A8FC2|nr:hypothetical protein [Longimicrobium sp.]HSU15909.1 hypothetical protein [Longimicrobium sp.]
MAERRNQLALLTEAELRAALEIGGTPETARAVAAQVYAVPAEEQHFFEWIDTTLMFASCVSGELSERIAAFFGSTPELRAQLEEQQHAFRQWVAGPKFQGPVTPLGLDDVVFDVRTEASARAEPADGEAPTA